MELTRLCGGQHRRVNSKRLFERGHAESCEAASSEPLLTMSLNICEMFPLQACYAGCATVRPELLEVNRQDSPVSICSHS